MDHAVDTAAGEVALHNITLTPGAEDLVSFAATPESPSRANTIEVISDGVDDLYFTVDGSDATVGGRNCYRLPKGALAARERQVLDVDAIEVHLISPGATTYSVTLL